MSDAIRTLAEQVARFNAIGVTPEQVQWLVAMEAEQLRRRILGVHDTFPYSSAVWLELQALTAPHSDGFTLPTLPPLPRGNRRTNRRKRKHARRRTG